jgi:hypothetical protein
MVLDKSGSMTWEFDGTGMTRWEVLTQVVDTVVAQYESRIKFGFKLFPSARNNCNATCLNTNPVGLCTEFGGSACDVDTGVEVDTEIDNWNTIMQQLPNNAIDGCGTPTQSGYERGAEWLVANRPNEPKAMMLVADGAISPCTDNSEQGLVAAIGDMWSMNIPTYVVGIDHEGEGTTDELNAYAGAGGATNPDPQLDFYPGDDVAQLQTALDLIAADVATCDLQLSVAPPEPSLVEVSVQGVQVGQITATECAMGTSGWYYSTQYTTITLCGAACDDFKALSVPTAQVDYFCTAG